MLVIGLTGGIGMGKSEVARVLRELGATVIDADRVGHETYRPHSDGWRAVVEEFGPDIALPTGEIDRKKLGALVFADRSRLERLNRIVHPRIMRSLREQLQELEAQGVEVVVVEAAVLIEAGWTSLVDEVWVTTAPEEVAVQRVAARNRLLEEGVRARIRAQISSEERERYATVVLDNSGDLGALRRQVEAHWNHRIKGEGVR